MNNQSIQKREYEIDLKEFLWKLAEQWKAILLLSIITAFTIAGIKYFIDLAAYKESVKTGTEISGIANYSEDKKIDSILMSLPDSDREAVIFATNKQDWINKQHNYLDNSLLMHTDPTNQRVLKIIYTIDCDSDKDLSAIQNNYHMYIQSNEVSELIKPIIQADANNTYITELIYEQECEGVIPLSISDNIVSINMVLLDDTDANAIAESFDSIVMAHCSDLQDKYPHSLIRINNEVSHLYHQINVNQRNTLFSDVATIENDLNSELGKMSDEQRDAFDSIMTIINASAPDDYQSNSETATAHYSSPTFSPKILLLGFILGLVLYVTFYMMNILLNGFVYSASSLESYTRLRLLGEVCCGCDGLHPMTLASSAFIKKLRNKKAPLGVEQIADTLEAICNHFEVMSLSLFDYSDNDISSEFVASLAKELDDKGISSFIIGNTDIQSEKAFTTIKTAALIADSRTKISDINRLISLCDVYSINMIGCIFIST